MGAFGSIITHVDVGGILTSILIACIVRARVVIIALQFRDNANSAETRISNGAGKPVITGGCVGGIFTFSRVGIAAIIGTRIAIITILRGTGACPVHTSIYYCAYIVVIADIVVVGIHTTGIGIAGIVRADIVIIAIHDLNDANAIGAGIVKGAGIVVITGDGIGLILTAIHRIA